MAKNIGECRLGPLAGQAKKQPGARVLFRARLLYSTKTNQTFADVTGASLRASALPVARPKLIVRQDNR